MPGIPQPKSVGQHPKAKCSVVVVVVVLVVVVLVVTPGSTGSISNLLK